MPEKKGSAPLKPPSPNRPSARTPPPSRNNMRLLISLFTLATVLLAIYAHMMPHADQAERRTASTARPSLEPPAFKFNHVGISVADLPAQIKWYSDILGFDKVVINYTALQPLFHTVQLMNSVGTVVELQHHAHSTRLDADKILSPLDRAEYQGLFHFALKVNNLNATYEYLDHAGVKLIAPPSCVDPYGCSAFVADPEDNIIEIVHYTFD